MSNPYQSPLSEQFYNQARQAVDAERQKAVASVQAAAIALLVVSGISLGLLALAIPIDLLLLVTRGFGRADEAKMVTIVIRLIWSVAIFAASGYCLFGAWQMKTLNNYQHAVEERGVGPRSQWHEHVGRASQGLSRPLLHFGRSLRRLGHDGAVQGRSPPAV